MAVGGIDETRQFGGGKREVGVCPWCGSEGPVGAPCAERACVSQGNLFIPRNYAARLQAMPASQRDPLIGKSVGDYLVVDVIGGGGFGNVYLTLQAPRFLLKAALKLMRAETLENAHASMLLDKFQTEADALAVLNHPNIVRLLKYGSHDGAPFLVMEFVENGRPLRDEVCDRALRGESLRPEDTLRILEQILDGLEAAHAHEIVHRDMKPENILLQSVAGNPLFVRIVDFGLAKFVDEGRRTSVAMGTPAYMAPEQMTRSDIGPWTDLYAVGVIAFELLTGRRPFAGCSQQQIIARKMNSEFDATAQLADLGLPAESLAFLRRAIHADTKERFRSTEEFRAALRGVCASPAREVFTAATTDLSGLLDAAQNDLMAPTIAAPSMPPGGDVDSALAPTSALATEQRVDARPHAPRARAGGPRRLWFALGGAAVAAAVALAVLLPRAGETSDGAASAPEFATQTAPEATPTPGAAEQPPPPPIELGWVSFEGGRFDMGGDRGDADELPEHPVTVSPFSIARSETTVAQYRACVDAGACTSPKEGRRCTYEPAPEAGETADGQGGDPAADLPVTCVDWHQAEAFCAWAGGRLPAEAEWEFAARSGGRSWRYPWGDQRASCDEAVVKDQRGAGCGENRAAPVCSHPAGNTEQGLCDMAGNVWEWVADCWHVSYVDAPDDGSAWAKQCASMERVFRGGSWKNKPSNSRTRNRLKGKPGARTAILGFRCAK